MPILILNGSPRRGGNTDILLRHLEQGIASAGKKARQVYLAELAIAPCMSCGACELDGHCLIEDDMQALYGWLEQADCIVLASPVYFYSVSAQAKAFIDRCQALWNKKYTLQQHDSKRRQGYLLAVAARLGEKTFDGIRLTARYFFDAVNCDYSAELLVRGADAKGSISKQPERLREAEMLGMSIARNC